MDYKKLQNGSDIRGVALEGIAGQNVNLTEEVCRNIGRGFALWLMDKTGKNTGHTTTYEVGNGVFKPAVDMFVNFVLNNQDGIDFGG